MRHVGHSPPICTVFPHDEHLAAVLQAGSLQESMQAQQQRVGSTAAVSAAVYCSSILFQQQLFTVCCGGPGMLWTSSRQCKNGMQKLYATMHWMQQQFNVSTARLQQPAVSNNTMQLQYMALNSSMQQWAESKSTQQQYIQDNSLQTAGSTQQPVRNIWILAQDYNENVTQRTMPQSGCVQSCTHPVSTGSGGIVITSCYPVFKWFPSLSYLIVLCTWQMSSGVLCLWVESRASKQVAAAAAPLVASWPLYYLSKTNT